MKDPTTLPPAELKRQVDHYSTFPFSPTLPFSRTSRGKAILSTASLLVLGAVIGLLLDEDPGTIYSVGTYVVLFFFVVSGHRWAMYGVIVLFVGETFLSDPISGYMTTTFIVGRLSCFILFALLAVPRLLQSIQVENERRRRARAD